MKKAAEITNQELGVLPEEKARLIGQVCDEILAGELDDNFPLVVWQTGSGTQSNMNVNEVIANVALELHGHDLGQYDVLHPNDHVNKGQSSNDVIPTAIHVTNRLAAEELLAALRQLHQGLVAKATDLDVIKLGRGDPDLDTPEHIVRAGLEQMIDRAEHLPLPVPDRKPGEVRPVIFSRLGLGQRASVLVHGHAGRGAVATIHGVGHAVLVVVGVGPAVLVLHADHLRGMGMDHQCLMAAILHDVIEDTPTAKTQLEQEFGPEIAELVDGVSKLTQIKFRSRAEAQAANACASWAQIPATTSSGCRSSGPLVPIPYQWSRASRRQFHGAVAPLRFNHSRPASSHQPLSRYPVDIEAVAEPAAVAQLQHEHHAPLEPLGAVHRRQGEALVLLVVGLGLGQLHLIDVLKA